MANRLTRGAWALVLMFGLWMTGGAPYAGTASEIEVIMGGLSIPVERMWEYAEACLVSSDQPGSVECFEDEEAMEMRVAEIAQTAGGTSLARCTGTVRLYDRTGYGTPVLGLSPGAFWVNLSAYGFDNRTSSYRIGPCDTEFAANPSGGGALYPLTLTNAYDVASSMQPGWDNRVSSLRYP